MIARDDERLAGALPWHVRAYLIGAAALILVNVLTGHGWWSFWPLTVWGIGLIVHWLYAKSITVDDAWVDKRARKLRLMSYEHGHMQEIEERYRTPRRHGPDRDDADA